MTVALAPFDVDALMGRTRIVPRVDAAARVATVTFEQIAEGGKGELMRHLKQLEFMQAASICEGDGSFLYRYVACMCSRRAAKSTAICGLMAKDASERNAVQIYLGKTAKAVRNSIWEQIWKPMCKRFFDKACSHHETLMRTTFDTGAVVLFTGSDDQSHIDNYLGNGFRRAVIDESQSQPDGVLRKLVDVTLPPACSDRGGQILLSGTIPEVPAGYFYEVWNTNEAWLKRNWSRFDNPHMGTKEFQQRMLRDFLAASKRTESDPLVQRDWYGREAFDTSATAYGYSIARDQYAPTEPKWLQAYLDKWEVDGLDHLRRTDQPDNGDPRHGLMAAEPLPGIEIFSCAIDPGARDRFTVTVYGWGSGTESVQHVFEYSSKRKAGLTWSQMAPVIKMVQEHYGPSWWWYDASGSKVVMDGFVADSGMPALMPAVKSGRKGQVDRIRDLMITGRLLVMAGSASEEDYQKTRWDPDKKAKMVWDWSSQWHPDPSESGRYALTPFFDMYVPEEHPKTQEEKDRRDRQRDRELYLQARKREEYRRFGKHPEDDEGEDMVLFDGADD